MPKRRSDELAAIDEVMPLVDQFNALEHAQRLIFLDMVDPLPEEAAPVKKAQKKAGRKSSSSSKSPRATRMESQLKSRVSEQREAAAKNDDGDDEDGPRCTYVMGDDAPCNETEHSLVHRKDGGYLNWHPFQHAVAPAPTRSPANGGAGSSTQNSEASVVNAGAATGGSGE